MDRKVQLYEVIILYEDEIDVETLYQTMMVLLLCKEGISATSKDQLQVLACCVSCTLSMIQLFMVIVFVSCDSANVVVVVDVAPVYISISMASEVLIHSLNLVSVVESSVYGSIFFEHQNFPAGIEITVIITVVEKVRENGINVLSGLT